MEEYIMHPMLKYFVPNFGEHSKFYKFLNDNEFYEYLDKIMCTITDKDEYLTISDFCKENKGYMESIIYNGYMFYINKNKDNYWGFINRNYKLVMDKLLSYESVDDLFKFLNNEFKTFHEVFRYSNSVLEYKFFDYLESYIKCNPNVKINENIFNLIDSFKYCHKHNLDSHIYVWWKDPYNSDLISDKRFDFELQVIYTNNKIYKNLITATILYADKEIYKKIYPSKLFNIVDKICSNKSANFNFVNNINKICKNSNDINKFNELYFEYINHTSYNSKCFKLEFETYLELVKIYIYDSSYIDIILQLANQLCNRTANIYSNGNNMLTVVKYLDKLFKIKPNYDFITLYEVYANLYSNKITFTEFLMNEYNKQLTNK